MSAESVVVCGVAGVVAVVNAVTMRRLWASRAFERPQKIAQSLLLWLVPGSFLVVRHFLGDHRPGRSLADGDTTSGDSGGVEDAAETGAHWESGHAGGFGEGGGHGGGGGGD